MSIKNMKESMMAGGVYSIEDINRIIDLELAFEEECEEIADECEAEGYPANGSNYDLRCAVARQWYDEELAYIDAKYEEVE